MRRTILVGLSPELREALRELSPDNMSAGVRACIILTRYYAGFTVSQLKSEAEKLIGESLPRHLKQTLMAIILDHPPPRQFLATTEPQHAPPSAVPSLPPPKEVSPPCPDRGEAAVVASGGGEAANARTPLEPCHAPEGGEDPLFTGMGEEV